MIAANLMEYLIRLTAIWLILFIFYRVVLYHNHNWKLRRGFLLLSYVIGILIPLLPAIPAAPAIATIDLSGFLTPEILISSEEVGSSATSSNQWSVFTLLLSMYTVISCIHMIRLFWNYLRLRRWKRDGQQTVFRTFPLILHKEIQSPFAGFNTIFLPTGIEQNYADMACLHESIHLKSKHSLERLPMLLGQIFFWFHPLHWVQLHELAEVQEYEADQGVLEEYSVPQYGKLLIQTSMLPSITWQPGFFSSPLKKRINMLVTNKNNKSLPKRYSIVLLCLMSFLLINCSDLFKEQTELMFSAETVDQVATLKLPAERETVAPQKYLLEQIYKTIKYPAISRSTETEGYFEAHFVVDKEGKIEDINVEYHDQMATREDNTIIVIGYLNSQNTQKSSGDGVLELKNEIIRTLSAIGDWEPAVKDDESVKSKMMISFLYKLDR